MNINKLYSQYRNHLYTFLLRRVHNSQDAEDLLDETFEDAIKGMSRFRGTCKDRTWLYAIAKNKARHFNRESTRRRVLMDRYIETQQPDYDEELVDECAAGTLDRLLGQIPKQQASCIRLQLEGFTINEISDILGVVEGTVKSRIFYGKELLREIAHTEDETI